jgi:hypothetical protein
VEYLLLSRQHVSALPLGHHQVSNCVSEETIQCSVHIVHIIQRDLVDNVTIDNCQKKLVYKIKIISYIRCKVGVHLIHSHAHLTHRVRTPDMAYNL